MLTLRGIGVRGEEYSLPAPVYVEIVRDEGVPADSLRVVIPEYVEREIAEIYVSDGDKEIFCGVVDEQNFISNETEKTEIVARSMAAVLLDNEACPRNFAFPCTQVIFERYIQPFGIEEYVGKDKSFQGNFDVSKGISCWQVAEKFGKSVFGAKPVMQGKTIIFSQDSDREQVVFSVSGDGIFYTGFEHSLQRCKLLSAVKAKTQAAGEYDTIISCAEAKNSAVVRERYLDVSPYSGQYLISAYEALEKSLRSVHTITLKCPSQHIELLGSRATIKNFHRDYEGFSVKSLRYVQNGSDEYTRVTLCRKEN